MERLQSQHCANNNTMAAIEIPVPPSGDGVSVDVSSLPGPKTLIFVGFSGDDSVYIDASFDSVHWARLTQMTGVVMARSSPMFCKVPRDNQIHKSNRPHIGRCRVDLFSCQATCTIAPHTCISRKPTLQPSKSSNYRPSDTLVQRLRR